MTAAVSLPQRSASVRWTVTTYSITAMVTLPDCRVGVARFTRNTDRESFGFVSIRRVFCCPSGSGDLVMVEAAPDFDDAIAVALSASALPDDHAWADETCTAIVAIGGAA